DDREVDLGEDVVAGELEARVASDVILDVGAARRAASGAGVARAANADPLAVVDPGRNLDLELLRLDHAVIPRAGRGGRLEERTASETGRTGLGADELTEDAARDLLQLALAAAGLAGDALGPRLGALPVADLAGDRHFDLDGPFGPGERIRELDR